MVVAFIIHTLFELKNIHDTCMCDLHLHNCIAIYCKYIYIYTCVYLPSNSMCCSCMDIDINM